jgi:branched-chain amino acid transport system permease protein
MPMRRFSDNLVVRYLLLPLGQIVAFILGTSVVLSAFIIAAAYLFRGNVTDFDLVERVFLVLPKVLLDGITFGFVYASIALGYTMVYGVLEFINFAHSEIFMLGGVVGVLTLNFFEDRGLLSAAGDSGASQFVFLGIALLLGMLASGAVAVVVERIAYRPLLGAPRLVPLISAIGVSFILSDLTRLGLNVGFSTFDVVVPVYGTLDQQIVLIPTLEGLLPLQIQVKSVVIIVVTIAMLIGLNYFVGGTRRGAGIRAVAQNRPVASLMGINATSAIALTFLIGGLLGGAAGLMYGLKASRLNAFTGFLPGLRAFTAAVLGGIGNLTGALLGGLVLGVLESFAGAFLSMFTNGAFGAEYKDIVTFAILIVVLVFRPSGLLGSPVGQKA